jgi:ankyrin repeat protein
MSAYYGHLEVVKYLVSQGADINQNVALIHSAANGHLEVVKYLIFDCDMNINIETLNNINAHKSLEILAIMNAKELYNQL